MDANFLESWVNSDDHQVLGHRLHPFCLYDILSLELVDSPFLRGAGGVSYTPLDLILAARICSHSFESNVRFLRTNGLRKRLYVWRDLRKCRGHFVRECQHFVDYIDDYWAPPEVFTSEDSGEIKSPWVLAYAAKLMTSTSMGEAAIMTMPIGKVLWFSATMGELAGSDAEIVSEEEAEAMRKLGY